MNFPERLKKLRKEHGLTQEELGKSIGASKGTIYQYESGQRKPNFEYMKKLEEFFKVSSSYLRGESTLN